ncbi:MAG: MaoC family dehydratase, partial [Rhizobiales bacterium]|nr:MaoC family dehydratase [Hyphomicrobiales bacterium]
MPANIYLKDIPALVGTELGVSRWFVVDQTMIDRFADATQDHQYIHTDPARAAAETPFGGTIAHGFLTLSLLSAMNFDCVPRIIEQTMGINYGFEKVRFMAPVKSGT